jgi:hypothetical protein
MRMPAVGLFGVSRRTPRATDLSRAPRSAGSNRSSWLLAVVLATLAAATFGVRSVAAQDPKPPRLVDIKVGLVSDLSRDTKHLYRYGYWTPITLTFEGGDQRVTGSVQLTANDGDGVPVIYRSSPLLLLPKTEASTTIYARLGSNSELGIVLRDENNEALFRGKLESVNYDGGPFLPSSLDPNDRLIVSVGDNKSLNQVRFKDRNGTDRAPEIVHFGDPTKLPTKRIGYDAVDCVVLRADRQSRYAGLTRDSAQWSALRSWVEQGGKLVIIAGGDVESLLSSGGLLGDLLPVRAEGMTSLPRTTALEKAAGNARLNLDAESLGRIRVLRIRETEGKVELAEGDLPLIVRRAVGLGRVTLSTVDFESAELFPWSPRRNLIRQMIDDFGTSATTNESSGAHAYSGYGYTDLAGQLRSALDQYKDVQVISFFTLAMLVLAYIALVGPGDFLLVRKLLRRTELTWVTLPLIVLVTTVGAHYLAVAMKGNELRTNQVDVVDCDAKTGVIRGVSYAGVFSPSTTQYNVRLRPADRLFAVPPETPEVVTTWLGLQGNGLGAMGGPSVAGDWFAKPYESTDELSTLTAMPIQVWSSKIVTGRWNARAPQSLHAPLTRTGDRLAGEVRNPFKTSLVDVWLFHDGQAYKIDRLNTGESKSLRDLQSQTLRNILTDVHVLENTKKYEPSKYAARPYDAGSLEVGGIIRQMLFFETSGGFSRTNLENRYQGFLDAGELLSLNRAILVGLVAKPEEFGPELTLKAGGADAPRNHDNRYMVVRLMIPVESSAP